MALHPSRVRFVELMTELFQLDEAESLDFGLYRVIRRHNREVREFLGEVITVGNEPRLQGGWLDQLLNDAFARTDDETLAELHEKLQEMESQLGLSPRMTADEREAELARLEKTPLAKKAVRDYRTLIEQQRASQTVEWDRDEVLNRLYQFFARHYQDGDFIVERRYGREGSRYIRSTGEDTEFHWATEEMYYVKSGDIFTDYPVRLSSGQRLIFSVAPDTLQETRASLKPSDKAHYVLAELVMAEDGSLKVMLDYLKGGQTETKKNEIVSAIKGRLGGDEAEIKRWLNHFITRNQSDFFIHKRLKEALTEDLDIFIKTEVLDADQLLADGDLPRRMAKVARIARQVGRQIIDFLATLEDFQKQLWEKKKLVFSTRYVITLDRIAKLAGENWLNSQIDAIVVAQKTEWRELGLGEYRHADDCVEEIPGDLATPDRRRWLPLPVDTRNLDDEFKWALLRAVTAEHALDGSLDGVALHSDNWQAINTCERKYSRKIKVLYADPPYNTDAGPISYKNGYRKSSWAALIDNRLHLVRNLLAHDALACLTIDDYQKNELIEIINKNFGVDNIHGTIVIKNSPSGRPSVKGFRVNHEYAIFVGNSSLASIGLIERSDAQSLHFGNKDEKGVFAWENFRKRGGATTHREARPKQFYPIYVNGDTIRIPSLEWNKDEKAWAVLDEPSPSESVVFPINDDGTERVWSWGHITALDNIDDLKVKTDASGHISIHRKVRPIHEGSLPSTLWLKKEYSAVEHGSVLLKDMFGSRDFAFPKSVHAVEDCLRVCGLGEGDYALDTFAGSGTTAHAVIQMNIKDGGCRKFIIFEANDYIDDFSVPRIIKASCSSRWDMAQAKKLDGPGLFMRVQTLEQYEDTLENLDQAQIPQTDLDFEDPAFRLCYRLDRDSNAVYCATDHFRSPWGYQLRRVEGGGDVPQRDVDLVESLIYLLGMQVDRLYRESEGVIITGQDRRQQSISVLFRDCDHENSASWCEQKLNQHEADRVFTNHAAALSFEGCDRFEAIETVFASQFER